MKTKNTKNKLQRLCLDRGVSSRLLRMVARLELLHRVKAGAQ